MIRKSNYRRPFLALLVLMALFAAVLASSGGPRNSQGEPGPGLGLSILSGPATISGKTVAITGAGHVVVGAAKAGDGNYDAAPAVAQAFDVASGAPSPRTVFNSISDASVQW